MKRVEVVVPSLIGSRVLDVSEGVVSDYKHNGGKPCILVRFDELAARWYSVREARERLKLVEVPA